MADSTIIYLIIVYSCLPMCTRFKEVDQYIDLVSDNGLVYCNNSARQSMVGVGRGDGWR